MAQVRRVAVEGGDLAYEVLPGSTEPVLAVHGISSTRRLWDWLRVEAPEISLIAPDLRGRADSIDVAGPSSVQQHARDLIAVLDDQGIDRVVVCGMSMGGFIAVALATTYPDRVKSLVLVDGGFPMAKAPGLTPELLPVVFKDRLDRLEHRWDNLDDYLAFFTGSTAPLLDPADPVLRGYLAHDLKDGRVRLSGQALLDDAADIFFGGVPWQDLALPVRWLHAQWSTGPDSAPAYPPEMVAEVTQRLPQVVATYVPGVDHAGSIMTPVGAAATAAQLRAVLDT